MAHNNLSEYLNELSGTGWISYFDWMNVVIVNAELSSYSGDLIPEQSKVFINMYMRDGDRPKSLFITEQEYSFFVYSPWFLQKSGRITPGPFEPVKMFYGPVHFLFVQHFYVQLAREGNEEPEKMHFLLHPCYV